MLTLGGFIATVYLQVLMARSTGGSLQIQNQWYDLNLITERRTRLTEGLNHGIKLYTAHKPKIRIAKFNQADLIPGLKRHTEAGGGSANLEIYPEGEHIVDCIVVTLCYIEKLRRDRERAAAS